MLKGVRDLRNNEETSRVGTKWSPEENDRLVQEIYNKKSFEDIALIHKRTITGIKSHVISHILYKQYKDENKSIDDLSSEYNIEKYLVEKYINKIDINNAIKKSIEKNNSNCSKKSDEVKPKTNMKLLFEKIATIETKMLTVEQKLNFIISFMSK